jgi:hypothetical protein
MIISRGMRWMWLVAHMRQVRNVYEIFVGKLEGNRPF